MVRYGTLVVKPFVYLISVLLSMKLWIRNIFSAKVSFFVFLSNVRMKKSWEKV